MTIDFTPLVRLVDDDDTFRESLRLFLSALGIEIADWSSARAFLADFNRDRPGCVVLDMRMPGMTGLECQRELAASSEDIPVIFLTGHGSVTTAVHAMKDGAFDFFEKDGDPMLLVAAVKRACERSVSAFHEREADNRVQAVFDSLTAREQEVLRMAANGLSNKDMAERLGLSPETIKMHRSNAFGKIGVKSALEAYQWLENVPNAVRGVAR